VTEAGLVAGVGASVAADADTRATQAAEPVSAEVGG
jgi:hypothetical protein